MECSNPNLAIEIAAPSESMVLRGTARFEPFNGSDAMLSVRGSLDELKSPGPHEVILTVREGTDAVWTRTITIR